MDCGSGTGQRRDEWRRFFADLVGSPPFAPGVAGFHSVGASIVWPVSSRSRESATTKRGSPPSARCAAGPLSDCWSYQPRQSARGRLCHCAQGGTRITYEYTWARLSILPPPAHSHRRDLPTALHDVLTTTPPTICSPILAAATIAHHRARPWRAAAAHLPIPRPRHTGQPASFFPVGRCPASCVLRPRSPAQSRSSSSAPHLAVESVVAPAPPATARHEGTSTKPAYAPASAPSHAFASANEPRSLSEDR